MEDLKEASRIYGDLKRLIPNHDDKELEYLKSKKFNDKDFEEMVKIKVEEIKKEFFGDITDKFPLC